MLTLPKDWKEKVKEKNTISWLLPSFPTRWFSFRGKYFCLLHSVGMSPRRWYQGRDTGKREEPTLKRRVGQSSTPMKSGVHCDALHKWCQAVGGRGAGTNLVTQGPILLHISCSRHRTWKVNVMTQNPRPLLLPQGSLTAQKPVVFHLPLLNSS